MYTVEVFKKDKRTKSGERLVHKADYDTNDLSTLAHTVKHTWRVGHGFRAEIYETYVYRTNLMSGQTFKERYDTPYHCSPASETYWST
jgi:hypothetical protein